jgi:hypothetical protein
LGLEEEVGLEEETILVKAVLEGIPLLGLTHFLRFLHWEAQAAWLSSSLIFLAVFFQTQEW